MSKYEKYRDQSGFDVPETMQAVVLSGVGLENISCRAFPVPQVGPNQLLCRVDAAGVCTSILKLIAQGGKHTFLNGWDPNRHPVVVGDEGALTVAKVGQGLVGQYRPGQRFAIQPAVDVAPINHRERYANNAEGMKKCAVGYTLGGNLAQYILIQEEVMQGRCLLPLPDEGMPYFSVSMAEPISCICSAQERHIHIQKDSPNSRRVPKLGILPGGTAVVIGAGPMGLMHVEMAMRFGPRNLIVCDVIRERLDRAMKMLGEKADRLGVRLIAAHGDQLDETLHRVSCGAGADDIILAVGVRPVQQRALGLLGRGGVANLFGGLPRGQHVLELDAIAVHYDEIKVVGSSGGEPSDLMAALEAIANHDIDPGNYVCGIGSLKHVPRVLRMIEEKKVDGKVIIYPHAEIDELQVVSYWDRQNEIDFLNRHLKA